MSINKQLEKQKSNGWLGKHISKDIPRPNPKALHQKEHIKKPQVQRDLKGE